MKATLPYLRERFEHFNHLCFGGVLPVPAFRLTTASSYIGQMRYRHRRGPDGSWQRYAFTMSFSTRFELDEAEVEDTIIHEMIHYYIDFNNLQDTSIHGRLFRQLMNDINLRFNRHITISLRDPEILNTDSRQRPAVICVSRLIPNVPLIPATSVSRRRKAPAAEQHTDASPGITVCATSRILQIARDLPRRYALLSTSWYYTTDPFFNRYPRCREARIYTIDSAELHLHLKEAIPLQFDGKKFTRLPQ